MIAYIVSALAGAVLTAGAFLITSEEKNQVGKNLTKTEILKMANKKSNCIFRETYCTMSQVDKTGASRCEAISNVCNSEEIINFCEKKKNYEKCINLFLRRK